MDRFDPRALRRLVVKIGSSLLVDEQGNFDAASLKSLAADLATLHAGGSQLLVVSSGAVALGAGVLGIDRRRARLDELQGAAAAGQVRLVNAWQAAMGEHGLSVAQVLLTADDTEDRRRFLNARGTLETLLERRLVPVINENDTVATDELRYGDNDRLAARVAQMIMADGLILLSDVDGLYSADPRADSSARHIDRVDRLDDSVVAMAGGSGSAIGTGGMRTKLHAARIATRSGCLTVVASGRVDQPLLSLGAGQRCTRFAADTTPAAARKQWLAAKLEVLGTLTVDTGAGEALERGSSLLPVGVSAVDGDFGRGDAVTLATQSGTELGRGLACYDADEVRRLIGCRSEDIESRLGYRGRSVVVHRDDLVLF